jgi:protein-tyrosine phosphatase
MALCSLKHPEWEVISRGVAACDGAEASKFSADIAAEYGCDLSGHRARLVLEEDMEWADAVYGLTSGHSQMLRALFPAFADKVKDLSGDIADPIGGTQECYRACAARLEGEIAKL